MKMVQTNLRLGSAGVSSAGRTAGTLHLFANTAIVRRETRRTATGTVALPQTCCAA
jgi:hypothetical protein